MLYPSLCLSTNNVIMARSKSRLTKRNNSCLRYIANARTHWGILEKIFAFNTRSTPGYFCVISTLQPAFQLCTDEVTWARLQDHFVACQPPRLVFNLVPGSHTHSIITLFLSCSLHQVVVVSCASVLEKCVLMDLKLHLGLVFVSSLPNTEEID